MIHALISIALILFPSPSFAGRVRTLYTDGQSMVPIFVSLGRSTVLRFDERPKPVIVGNQNYYNIEYLGNDVSIQPLGRFETNLFAYTESITYGFILKPGSESNYDDLIVIKYRPRHVKIATNKKARSLLQEAVLNQRLMIQNKIDLIVQKAIRNEPEGVILIDFALTNLQKNDFKKEDLTINQFVSNQPLTSSWVLEKDNLRTGEKTKGRLVIPFKQIQKNWKLAFSLRGENKSLLIPNQFKWNLK